MRLICITRAQWFKQHTIYIKSFTWPEYAHLFIWITCILLSVCEADTWNFPRRLLVHLSSADTHAAATTYEDNSSNETMDKGIMTWGRSDACLFSSQPAAMDWTNMQMSHLLGRQYRPRNSTSKQFVCSEPGCGSTFYYSHHLLRHQRAKNHGSRKMQQGEMAGDNSYFDDGDIDRGTVYTDNGRIYTDG